MVLVISQTKIPILPNVDLLFEQTGSKALSYICPRIVVQGSSFPLRVVNPSNEPIQIYKGTTMGHVESVDHIEHEDRAKYWAHHNVDGLDLTDCDLDYDQRDKLLELLRKYSHIFVSSNQTLTGTDAMQYSLKLNDPNMTPIKQRAYRVPQSKRKEIDAHLDKLLEVDIISPSCSPWASPVVLVAKKDGGSRLAIDYRRLNEVTISDAYPLPRLDDAVEFLNGAKYLTTLDCAQGFHQVELEKESRPLTAFITGRGLYEFNKVPFGIKQGPACFQRLMNFVLSGLLFQSAMIYLDDILVAGKTFEEMLSRLETVFERLQQYNIKLKFKKCAFARRQLPFLGYLLTSDGIRPDPSNVEKIKQAPAPKNVRDVRSFIGAASFYRKWIPGFSTIVKPITSLLRKGNRFQWSSLCKLAHQTILNKLTSAPILIYPNFDKPFVLCTDASQHGCGAVLAQSVEGREAPIAFFSRTFSKAESRYETVERELFAVVLALKHFRHIIYGRPVVIYSDQKSLSWGIKQTESNNMTKWIAKLSEYDIKVFYRPGPKMAPADYLSRMVSPSPSDYECVFSSELMKISIDGGRELFSHEQSKDPVLSQVIKSKTSMSPFVFPSEVAADAEAVNRISWFHPEFGCLYKTVKNKSLLFVPKVLQSRIISEAHDAVWSGHMSAQRTLDRIKERFFWVGMDKDVADYVSRCHDCLRSKAPTHPTREEMVPIPAVAPWRDVVMDVLGPLPTSRRGNKFILVVVDRFTKWPECRAMPNQTAARVAECFLQTVVCRHGLPESVQTDLGSNFTSSLFQEVGKLLGMKHKFSTSYHPASQGICERMNRTLLGLLKAYVSSDQKDWCSYLDLVLLAYRTSVHSSSNFTPFQLVYGREANLPSSFLVPKQDLPEQELGDFSYNLSIKLTKIRELAAKHMEKASLQQKTQKDKRAHPSQVKPGDQVHVYVPHSTPGTSPKLASCWPGPYLVLKRSDPNVLIQWSTSSRRNGWVHLDRTRLVGADGALPAPSADYRPAPPAEVKTETGPYNLRPRH